MSEINKLIEFLPKTKAASAEINENFEKLRLSNNEHNLYLDNLQNQLNEYKLNNLKEINCNDSILTIDDTTNNFKVNGTTSINKITGVNNGFAIIEFTESRLIENNNYLKLQNNVDKITKAGDVGIYRFDNEFVKEVNYFTSKEEKTNTLTTQTIIDAPLNEKGRASFLKKAEFTKDIMPIMTSLESDDCIISASSQYNGDYVPWKAFRHHTNDPYGWLTIEGVKTGWIKVCFRNKKPKITLFSINSRNSSDAPTHSPCDFILEGSNDDTNWTLLGDFKDNLNWLQNEKRYFALTFFDRFKYYRLSITKHSGTGPFVGFGALEFYETTNEYLPMQAKAEFSVETPLLFNVGKGKTSIGKINQLSMISQSTMIENLYNNSISYIKYIKNNENRFKCAVTTACPVYSQILQRHSNKNTIPQMISYTTSKEFKSGYKVTNSSVYSSFHGYLAFNGLLNNKWMASVPGGNQWLQIELPNYRNIARFSIVASYDDPLGCIKNGFIKGFNGEEWIVLKEIKDEPAWVANEIRYYDVDILEPCNQFKLEITENQKSANHCQISEFRLFEVADCFVIPDNKFYSYNTQEKRYEEQEIIYIGRAKTQNNFVSDIQCYAIDNKYLSDETQLKINTTYSFFHNIGVDYKNIKISAWIKDTVNGFIMPWCVDSNLDSNADYNNYGFYVDDCQFSVRMPPVLMNYRDYNNVVRKVTKNATLILQMERSF